MTDYFVSENPMLCKNANTVETYLRGLFLCGLAGMVADIQITVTVMVIQTVSIHYPFLQLPR